MRFVCDAMLGKLSKYLRLLGFDAVYARTQASLDHYLNRDQDRLLLTRRKSISAPSRTVRIQSQNAREQLHELRGMIKSSFKSEAILSRCMECNMELRDTDRADIEPFVPEFVFHHYTEFKVCPSCKKVYWAGSHAKGMEELVTEIIG
jgi:uncharacterized protein with PIN domain